MTHLQLSQLCKRAELRRNCSGEAVKVEAPAEHIRRCGSNKRREKRAGGGRCNNRPHLQRVHTRERAELRGDRPFEADVAEVQRRRADHPFHREI